MFLTLFRSVKLEIVLVAEFVESFLLLLFFIFFQNYRYYYFLLITELYSFDNRPEVRGRLGKDGKEYF